MRGRDIKRYGYNWANLWLINTHNGVRGKFPPIDINEYPAVKAHLDHYWEQIRDRADQGNTPYNLRNCAYLEDFLKPKIIYPETTQGAYFALDTEGLFIDKTCFFLISPLAEHLQVILSSKLFEFAYKRLFSSVELGPNGYQYNKQAFLKLPIIKPLGNIISREVSDNIIYSLYRLTDEEVQYVENTINN